MKKTWWWRIMLVGLSAVVLLISYIGPCNFNFNRCLGGNSIIITRTVFHIFLAVFVISSFLFFVTDKVFLKWLRFSIAWVILSIILIALAPTSSGLWLPMNPTKEFVSIWMAILFVILSLGKIIWNSVKDWKNTNPIK